MTTAVEASSTDADANTDAGAPTDEAPRTGRIGWTLRVAVSLHTLVILGQPLFAGMYLSGDYDGLASHATGADIVSYISTLQLVVAAVAWVKLRRAWPCLVSAALLAAELVQYLAGMDGALWLHIPLGVMLVAAVVVMCCAVWLRPLPRRSR
jgi:hypothetical protein